MKLLIITMLYEPDCVGIAAMATDFCRGLAERGHDITVYTTYPYYPEWKLKCDANTWRIQRETIAGVKVVRHGLFIPRHPSRLLPRLIHEISFPISLLRSLFARDRFDAVMVYCPLLGSVAFAAFRKLFHRELLWLNVQDLPVEAGTATGINRSRIFGRVAAFVQRRLFNWCEAWSSISPEMVAQIAKQKHRPGNLYLCPNWLIAPLAVHVEKCPNKVGRQPASPVKLLYCGTIGKKQDLLRFCQHLSSFDLDFEFQIRGAGGESERVRNWIKSSGDRRFSFGDITSDASFVQAIHETDWFVITEMHGAGPSFLPSKLIPCISIGTPVLALCDRNGPLGNEMTNHRLGLLLEWSQINDLPRRLTEIHESPAAFARLQQGCLDHARDFARDVANARDERMLEEAIANHRSRSTANSSRP